MGSHITLSRDEMRLLLDTCPSEEVRHRYRVLALHDEWEQLDRLTGSLDKQCFDVDLCRDPSDALGLCLDLAYDLVIAGHRSGGFDGISFLSMVRDILPRAYRFLVSDGCDRETLVRAVNVAGIHAVIERPWPDVKFRQLIVRTFDIHNKTALSS